MDILTNYDFKNVARIQNLPNAASAQEPATKAQLDAAIEGLAWKDSARVATQANVNLSAPGATIDGITMAANDRVLVRSQTTASENGIYIFNGSATAMTRSPDASTSDELEQAVITVEEGTSAGATFRQTLVNFTIGSGAVAWTSFGTSAPASTETTAGIAELATQAETDAGTDDARIVTPLKFKASSLRAKGGTALIGDGSQTSYTVTHGFNTKNVLVQVFRESDGVEVIADITRGTVNAVTVAFASAPTANQYRVLVMALPSA